jgi:hypothetical protein
VFLLDVIVVLRSLSLNRYGRTRRGPSPPGRMRGGSTVGASSRTGVGQAGSTGREVAKLGRGLRLSSVDALMVVPYRVASSSGRTFRGRGTASPDSKKGRPQAALDTLYRNWVWFLRCEEKGRVPRMQHRGILSPGGAPGPPQLLRRFSSYRVPSSAASVARLTPLQGSHTGLSVSFLGHSPVTEDRPHASRSAVANHRRQTTWSSAPLSP